MLVLVLVLALVLVLVLLCWCWCCVGRAGCGAASCGVGGCWFVPYRDGWMLVPVMQAIPSLLSSVALIELVVCEILFMMDTGGGSDKLL